MNKRIVFILLVVAILPASYLNYWIRSSAGLHTDVFDLLWPLLGGIGAVWLYAQIKKHKKK